MPAGMGGISSRLKRPSDLLSLAIGRSPCSTCTGTSVWLLAAVLKMSLLRTGMVVLRSISLVNTPPFVSIPRRSEERRVGKECRSRWWRDEYGEEENRGEMGGGVGGEWARP